jgi:hypothetical protein
MSRHGYSDDLGDEDPLQLGRWRGRVASAIRGRRGQQLLRDLRDALDAMPEKRLIAEQLEADGEVCALGAVGRARGIEMSGIDPEDSERVAAAFDIAEPLAREITYENDENYNMTPEGRWKYMRSWVERRIKPEGAE